MTHSARIDRALEGALALARCDRSPPRLCEALRYAVFPGGARVRPQLTLAVAAACGDDAPELTDAAGAAVELLHCASLVHDDMPCFDDADLRRGKPTVHRAFGQPLALLAGDALIVLAFELIARGGAGRPERVGPLTSLMARSVGASDGIIAGQAWECEPSAALDLYHQMKTGALFVAAVSAGALAAGADPAPWRRVGERIGAAYQIADDLMDALGDSAESGKSSGRDEAFNRPSAVRRHGVGGAVALLEQALEEAADAVPPCAGASALRETVRIQALRLVPKSLAAPAA